jgi:hypothetical protein
MEQSYVLGFRAGNADKGRMRWVVRISALAALLLAVAAVLAAIDFSLSAEPVVPAPPAEPQRRSIESMGLGTRHAVVQAELGRGRPAGRAASRRRDADCVHYDGGTAVERYELCFRRGRLVSAAVEVQPAD